MKDDVNTTEETVEETTTPQAGMSLQDLAILRHIVDVATKRGAFQANELEIVGRTYNALDRFLSSLTKKEGGEADSAAGDEETTAE